MVILHINFIKKTIGKPDLYLFFMWKKFVIRFHIKINCPFYVWKTWTFFPLMVKVAISHFDLGLSNLSLQHLFACFSLPLGFIIKRVIYNRLIFQIVQARAKFNTGLRWASPLSTFCSYSSCSLIVRIITGALAPLTTATSSPAFNNKNIVSIYLI